MKVWNVLRGLARPKPLAIFAVKLIILCAILGGAGYYLYTRYNVGGSRELIHPVTQQSFEAEAARTFDEGRLMYLAVCTPEVCAMQRQFLEVAAEKYADRVSFYEADPSQWAALMEFSANQLGSIVLPAHIILLPDAAPKAIGGLLSDGQIARFIESAIGVPEEPLPVYEHITQVGDANFEEYMQSIGAGESVLIVVCSPDLCRAQLPLVDKVAAANPDLNVVWVDMTTDVDLTLWVAQFTKQLAWPSHLFINTESGAVMSAVDMLSEQDLTAFIEAGYEAEPQPAAEPTAPAGADAEER